MYFKENKEDTNIDKEFSKKKKTETDYSKYRLPLIIIGVIFLLFLIIYLISLFKGNKTEYYITLEGSEEMTIYKGTTYNEPGCTGFDNKSRTYDVDISGEVNSNKAGTYTITYTLKNVEKTRTVKVLDTPDIPTILHLTGDKNMTIKKGEKYVEPGYNAIDYKDGDITKKVTIGGIVNTSKVGVYRIVYSVVNSEGVTTSETRVVTVE